MLRPAAGRLSSVLRHELLGVLEAQRLAYAQRLSFCAAGGEPPAQHASAAATREGIEASEKAVNAYIGDPAVPGAEDAATIPGQPTAEELLARAPMAEEVYSSTSTAQRQLEYTPPELAQRGGGYYIDGRDDLRYRPGGFYNEDVDDEQNRSGSYKMDGGDNGQAQSARIARESLQDPLQEDFEEEVEELEPRITACGAVLEDGTQPLPSFIVHPPRIKRPPLEALEALKEVKASARAKFDESVEVAMQLGTDPRRGDQQVRGTTMLPHGTGKSVRVAVFTDSEMASTALQAGADIAGGEDLIASIQQGGNLDFDKCLATPDIMPKLARIARILGPRGLMPNPKLRTIVPQMGLKEAINALKAGQVEYRADKTAIVHAAIGKVSFPEEHLYVNFGAFAKAILAARPPGAKASGPAGYILKAYVTSTMGRSIPLKLPSLVAAATAVQQAR